MAEYKTKSVLPRKAIRLRQRRRVPVSAGITEPRRTGDSARVPVVPPPMTGNAQLDELAARIRVCTQCPLHLFRHIAVPGEGKGHAKFMIIGEAPGSKEDQTGKPFVGSAGRYLEHILKGTSFTRADFFITNIVKCHPPSNRNPKAEEVDTCTSLYLFNQIRFLDPLLILLLGAVAVKTLLGFKSVEEARGRIVEHEGRRFLASYHPAVRFYREDLAQEIKEDFELMKRHLSRP